MTIPVVIQVKTPEPVTMNVNLKYRKELLSSPFLGDRGGLGDVLHGTGLKVSLQVLSSWEAHQAERADEALLRARPSSPRARVIPEAETPGGRVRHRLGLLRNVF